MSRYQKMLIPVNGSLDGLREGLRLALDEHCLVIVLKVFPSYEGELDLTGVRSIGQVLSSNRDQEVAAIKQVISEEGALARVIVEQGDLAPTIQKVAQAEGCDLILLGAEKRHPLRRLLEGNLVDKVINLVRCPVLVAKT